MEIKDEGEENTMNENLSQMVREAPADTGMVFSETDLDLPIEEVTPVEVPAAQAATETDVQANVIPISTLADWFEANSGNMTNINQVKVAIRGVDANRTLIMAVKDNDGEVDADGNDKRTLRVFDNADSIPVLNLPPLAMDVYNNGFKIVYHQNGIFIKTYGVRTGLICTLCTEVNSKLIPYAVVRVKKKDDELTIPSTVPTITAEKLAAAADLESLQLLYKQSAKSIEDLTTNQSVIDWLIDRQNAVTDINHHLQIDNVLIDILK
jgi:hypothetical protein